MKSLFTFVVMAATITCYKCGERITSNPVANVEVYNADSDKDYMTEMVDVDSAIIASLETDSTLYDPVLVMNPIDDSSLFFFITKSNNADTIKRNSNYSIIKYTLIDSYVIEYQNDMGDKKIILLYIRDKSIRLSNGIEIGFSRGKVKELYGKEHLTGNAISIIEESEMAEIKLFFKNDVIEKIIYVDYESSYGLGLL